MKLSLLANGRDNNFNLIRFVAAFAVLVTHSFTLVTGDVKQEPLSMMLGMSIGSMAVDVFFVTSGFLVTASLINRKSVIDFVWARFLRIFPALWVMLVITICWAGYLSTLPIIEFLSEQKVYIYIVKCSTLLLGVAHTLPGVFTTNPYPNAINGSLWTMPNELRMYASLALAWVIFRFLKQDKIKLLKRFVILATIISMLILVVVSFPQSAFKTKRFIELFFMFFYGASYYVLREYIQLKSRWFSIALFSMLIATYFEAKYFIPVYKLLMPYALFYLVYMPKGIIRKFNKLGDYSYGIYIYAFPVQQSTVLLMPNISVLGMTCISGVITLLFAVTSWHLIEKPALALKSRYVAYTHQKIMRTKSQ